MPVLKSTAPLVQLSNHASPEARIGVPVGLLGELERLVHGLSSHLTSVVANDIDFKEKARRQLKVGVAPSIAAASYSSVGMPCSPAR